jgi:proteasome lid subunit RPN8/RPN11
MKPTKPAQIGVKLQIDNEVTRSIRQHARAHMKTEVCGVLIGEQRGDVVEVQASIEALNAAQAGTHVTFTQDAWEEIYRVKDQMYPDLRIVGWYHSHPGFGVFLSEHDTFIHRNFFSSPNQVAWVYDPHTDEEGCFGWFDGRIERIAAMSTVDLNGDGSERTPKGRARHEIQEPDFEDAEAAVRPPARREEADRRKPVAPWLRITVSVVSYLAVAVLGFFVAIRFFPPYYLAIATDPHTGEYIGFVLDPHTGEPLLRSDGTPEVVGPLHIEQILHTQPQLSTQPQPAAKPAPLPQSPAPQPPTPPAVAPAKIPGGTK